MSAGGRSPVDGTQAVQQAGELCEAAQTALKRASTALESAATAETTPAATAPLPPPGEHHGLHRSRCPPKIESDPELQAFIVARIERMTFKQLADAIADAFPPERQVRKSAIHAWWHRSRNTPDRPG